MTKEANIDNKARANQEKSKFNRPRRKQAGQVNDMPALKLSFESKDGMFRHWINDDEKGRLNNMLTEKDYEHVEDSQGKKVSKRVGTTSSGEPLMAYLLEMPQEWRDEDKAEKAARLKEQEQSIIKGTDDQGAVGQNGRIIPEWAKNKIEHKEI